MIRLCCLAEKSKLSFLRMRRGDLCRLSEVSCALPFSPHARGGSLA
nr:MAG TPA: hypothetical protein [Caudoviricetes sp.]